METISLQAKMRTATGKMVADLRAQGEVPGVLYGNGIESQSISMPYNVFEKVYRKAGESSLIDLAIDGKGTVKTLIYDITVDPLTSRFTHVDFFQVKMTEKLTTNIPLIFAGEAKAVKELGGIFVKNMDEVEVRCLPGDLVHEIAVDLAKLATFEDAITLKDLVVSKGIEILGDLETIVATVTSPISEAELKALDQAPIENVDQVAIVDEKGKKETAE
jgi:large subunit ribosomal protein L25